MKENIVKGTTGSRQGCTGNFSMWWDMAKNLWGGVGLDREGCVSARQGRARISWLKLYATARKTLICISWSEAKYTDNQIMIIIIVLSCHIVPSSIIVFLNWTDWFRLDLTLFMEWINWGRLTFFCGELKYFIIRIVVFNRAYKFKNIHPSVMLTPIR